MAKSDSGGPNKTDKTRRQYIDDNDGLVLNHTYIYTYGHQRFEMTLKDVFNGMVYEMNESVENFSLRKKNYKIRLSLEIIPKKAGK